MKGTNEERMYAQLEKGKKEEERARRGRGKGR